MTKEEIIQKVKDYLNSVDFPYDKEEDEWNFTCVYNEKGNHRTKGAMPLFTVGFRTVEIDGEHLRYFMIVDASTYELEYMMQPTGYVEIKK